MLRVSKRISVMVLALFTVISTVTQVSAFSSQISIRAEPTLVNITMPQDAAFIFNEDGTNIVPENFNIQNNSSISGIHIDRIQLSEKNSSGWKLSTNPDLTTLPVNEKVVYLKIGKEGSEKHIKSIDNTDKSSTGESTFDAGDFVIPASSQTRLSFDITRGSFTKPVESSGAFDMTIDFSFN